MIVAYGYKPLSLKIVVYLEAPNAVQVKYNCRVSKGKSIGHHMVNCSHQSGVALLASTSGSCICCTILLVTFLL